MPEAPLNKTERRFYFGIAERTAAFILATINNTRAEGKPKKNGLYSPTEARHRLVGVAELVEAYHTALPLVVIELTTNQRVINDWGEAEHDILSGLNEAYPPIQVADAVCIMATGMERLVHCSFYGRHFKVGPTYPPAVLREQFAILSP